MRSWFLWVAAAATLFIAPAASAQKLPSAYQGSRDQFFWNGKQNMPFKLYGIAIEWDKDCTKGKADQCIRLAKAFETGLGDLEADMRVAVGYYMRACEKGSGPGCATAAKILRDGSAGFTNPAEAQKMAERGCNVLKDQNACAGMAVGLAGNDGGRSSQLIDNACAAGADDGCRMKANALFYDKRDSASRAEAMKMFETACTARRAWGCQGLADAYGQGLGVTADRAKAADYARIGCTQGQGNRLRLCTLHGIALTRVGSPKADFNKGEQFLDASCKGGDGLACNQIGRIGVSQMAGATTTDNEGRYYLRRGCDLNYGPACTYLAAVYMGGVGVNQDNAVALALNDKGCRLGDREGCDISKRLLAAEPGLRGRIPAIDPAATVEQQLRRGRAVAEGTGDRMAGVQAVYRLVQEGNEDAEWLFGGWLYYGLPGVFDTSRRADGLILFENAARVGHIDAAVFMGMAYWYGDGVAEDRTKGERYMLIAADRGSPMAAAIYRSMRAEPIRQENARRQKEYAAWAESRRSSWAQSWSSWTPSFSLSGYNPPSYTGPSTADIIRESNWNQRINYLSGSTTACPSSNPYC
ncbi:hypothetical protein OF829_18395 [Sphingomonas sp. LB-2]|uniref:tetratricopeptide repeat protein n=1 Tax=Sphingomonas caeni TaxID=2984949 RepID=UPI00222E5C9D|nr:hypothetical protein [Sphingomonas caeni]MCW3849212.1 hypothetical protein [Sphingomonas caeni]